MKLLEKIHQHRRDFTGQYECEGCGHKEKITGYDDDYFHGQVMPKRKCLNCQQSTISLGKEIEFVETKYAPHQIV